jgi:DNA-binding transcriptional MocR family regulator
MKRAASGCLDLLTSWTAPSSRMARIRACVMTARRSPAVLALDCARSSGIENTRTLYCGSFSKTLSPGLRLGWVCAASDVISRLVLMKQAGDLHSSSLNQEAMARVAETVFDAQVDKVRAAYRERRDAMLAALENHMPEGTRWTRPEGGMFVWVELPEGSGCGRTAETRLSKRPRSPLFRARRFSQMEAVATHCDSAFQQRRQRRSPRAFPVSAP